MIEVQSRMDWSKRRLERREPFGGSRNSPPEQASSQKNKCAITEFLFYLKEKSNTNILFLSYTYEERDANLKEAMRAEIMIVVTRDMKVEKRI